MRLYRMVHVILRYTREEERLPEDMDGQFEIDDLILLCNPTTRHLNQEFQM
jgi:hypothetical protein